MRRTRSTTLVALLAGLAMLAVACGSSAKTGGGPAPTTGAGKPVIGGTLIDLQNFIGGDPDHLDPALSSVLSDSQPAWLMFEPLTITDPVTGALKPGVATTWSANANDTVWTFHLRKEHFSNGMQVMPSDFKYAWERVNAKSFGSTLTTYMVIIKGAMEMEAGTATSLSGVVADDAAMSLTVTTTSPYSVLPQLVSYLAFAPVPKQVVSVLPNYGKDWEKGVMIGNGPFAQASALVHNVDLKMVRNETYDGALGHKAYLDGIDFRITKDVNTAFTAFQAGQGMTTGIPPGQYTAVKQQYGDGVKDSTILGTYYWTFNLKDPQLGGAQNVKLREAIALAIDKDAINNSVYNGSRVVATEFTPPGIPGYQAGLNNFPGRDLNKAKAALAAWEAATGKKASSLTPLKLNFNAGHGHENVATIVQANLKEIGVPSVLAPSPQTTYFDDMEAGKGTFVRAGWIWDFTAYDDGIYYNFYTKAFNNITGYSNPDFDKLMNEARASTDPATQNSKFHQAEQLLLNKDVVVVPLNWYRAAVIVSSKVHGFVMTPLDFGDYADTWLTP